MNVLMTFPDEKTLRLAQELPAAPSVIRKAVSRSFEKGNGSLRLAVIRDMRDVQHLSGYHFDVIITHEDIPAECKEWLATRVRESR